jgi:hypothetical protein
MVNGAAGGTIYLDGVSVATTAITSVPYYTSTAVLNLGYEAGGANIVSNSLFHWFAWWNRALTPVEHGLIGSGVNAVWQVFQPAWPRGLIVKPRVLSVGGRSAMVVARRVGPRRSGRACGPAPRLPAMPVVTIRPRLRWFATLDPERRKELIASRAGWGAHPLDMARPFGIPGPRSPKAK